MPLFGAHMSIAGGYYKAVESAARLKMDCLQIFTKNNNQWKAKDLSDDDIARFREAVERTGVTMLCAHDSYLINLASPKNDLWQKSLDAFVIELERAEALGLAGLVMHPGSFTESNEQAGLDRIVEALVRSLKQTDTFAVEIWIETTAGQGTSLGYKFEHLQYLLNSVGERDRLGICVDTCHIFAAGYPIKTPKEYRTTMDEFDRLVGTERIRAFHLNDSKREQGSRVDRHAHIGEGHLGREPFRHIVNDPRFAEIPMYLETPKGIQNGKEMDAVNLGKLRRLVRKSGLSRRRKKRVSR